MSIDRATPDAFALAERWWLVALRGVAAVLFGVLAFAMPIAGLLTLLIVWGAYALVDGAFNIVWALRGARAGRRWGWLLFEGVVSLVAGVLAFVWPGVTAVALLMVIAVWAVITGVAEIAAAIRLRHHIRGEWLLAAGGVLSIAFGILLIAFPAAGALAVVWMIGAYSLVFGVVLLALGLRLFALRRRGEGGLPRAGAPSPA